jgi:N-acetylglucosamine kinase-like BadF-type ATPase
MRYFLGIDIGNTKSHALIADENGYALGFGEGGNGNYETVGWDGLQNTLQIIIGRALTNANISKGQIAGAGFGIAGYDWPAEREPTRQVIASLGLSAPYEFVNDATPSLLAGASDGWGLVISAGTSNNCRGRDQQGREGRVTGCGPWAGEYGGASELIAKAIQAVALAWTRRGPDTCLTQTFMDLTDAADPMDLLEGLNLKRYRLSAADAPSVFETAAEGDAVAQEIIRWTGYELGSLAVGVIHQLSFEDLNFEVVLAGSLFNSNNHMLLEAMKAPINAVAPKARMVRLNAPPVIGGVLLGMEETGVKYLKVRQTLIETTNTMLKQDNE